MFELSKLSIDLTINRWTFNIELSLFPPACQYWDMYRCSSFFSPYVIYSSTSSTLLLTPISTTMSNIFLQVLISTVTFIISTADELQEVQFFSLLACDRKEFIWLALSSQTLISVLHSLNRQLYRMSQARLNSLGWFSSSSFWTISLWFSSPSSLPSDSSSAQIREGGQSSVVVFHKIFEIKLCQVHERANERDWFGCDIPVLHLPRPRRPRRLWNYRQDWKNYSAGKLRWGIIADRIFRISQW